MNSNKIIPLIDEIAREKNMHKDDVFYAIEHALLNLAKDRYGDADLSVTVNRDTGDIALYQNCVVVEDKPDCTQISQDKAKLIDPNANIGDKVQIILPFDDFTRIGTSSSINLLYKKLEELRKIREFAEFENRIGEIVNCIVKQTYPDGQIIATVGKGIGVMYRNDIIPAEINKIKPGDAITAYIKDVTQSHKHQILLSRTHNKFLEKLMISKVPELESGEIEIQKVVRDPGRRAKVAVFSHSPALDPVRVCVGPGGNRIQPVVSELKGERIDIIPWDENIIKFAVNAIKPATAEQAIFRTNNIILVVPNDQKKKAIGEFGVNVKLASALTGTNISVLTTQEAQERKQELEKFLELTLDIDNDISSLLVSKGFETIHDINSTETAELSTATEIDAELVEALKERVQEYTEETKKYLQSIADDFDERMIRIPGLKTPYLRLLYSAGIKKLTELAVQTPENLLEILKDYKVTRLAVDRFISYAGKQSGRIKKHRLDLNKPDLKLRRS